MTSSIELQQAKNELVLAFKPFGKKAFEFFKKSAWEDALIYFRGNFDLTSARVSNNLRQLGQTINNFAVIINRTENHELAEPAYNFAIMVHCELLDAYHSDAAMSLYNMGILLKDKKNDLKRAFDYLAQSLEIWKFIVRHDEPGYMHYLASCLHSLGEIFAEMEEYERARQNMEQALELRKSIFGSEHPDIAQSYGDLGTLYLMQGDLNTAKSYLSQSFYICRKTLGDTDPMTQSVNNMLRRITQMQN